MYAVKLLRALAPTPKLTCRRRSHAVAFLSLLESRFRGEFAGEIFVVRDRDIHVNFLLFGLYVVRWNEAAVTNGSSYDGGCAIRYKAWEPILCVFQLADS